METKWPWWSRSAAFTKGLCTNTAQGQKPNSPLSLHSPCTHIPVTHTHSCRTYTPAHRKLTTIATLVTFKRFTQCFTLCNLSTVLLVFSLAVTYIRDKLISYTMCSSISSCNDDFLSRVPLCCRSTEQPPAVRPHALSQLLGIINTTGHVCKTGGGWRVELFKMFSTCGVKPLSVFGRL